VGKVDVQVDESENAEEKNSPTATPLNRRAAVGFLTGMYALIYFKTRKKEARKRLDA
jgi:hypothetical protein